MLTSLTSTVCGERIIVRALLVAALFPFLTAFCFRDGCVSWESTDSLTNEIRQLDAASKTAAHAAVPFGWDAAVFVSTDTVQSTLGALKGVFADVPGSDAHLRLDDVRVKPGYGHTDVELDVTATRTVAESSSG